MRSGSTLAALVGLILLVGAPAGAVPTVISSFDTASCDVLSIPNNVEELGGMGGIVLPSQPALPTLFPGGLNGERIMTGAFGSAGTPSSCTTGTSDALVIPNQRVGIVNLQPYAYTDLWWVADLNTFNTNVDGAVNGLSAFKIDAVGVNTPLIAESQAADGIFAPGEMWTFILQDWSNNLLAAPHAFNQIGVATATGLVAPNLSTGSIIGLPVPEPSTGLLVLGGLLALARRRTGRA